MKTVGPRNLWTRSEEGWLAGVCQGIGESFDINPAAIRLGWVASVLFFGFGILLYFVCALCFPVKGQAEKDSVIFGVCHRLAQRMEIEVAVLRVFALFLLFGSFGMVSLIYIFLHFALADRDTDHNPDMMV